MANQVYDMTGDQLATDSVRIGYDAMTSADMTSPITVTAGTGAPTFSAAKGSIYSRIDGSSTSTRLYVNTNGSTTWTNVTTAA